MVLLHDDAEKYGRYQTCYIGDCLYMFDPTDGRLKMIDLNGDAGAVRETAGSAVSMI